MKIKVIANKTAKGQNPINQFIGQTFETLPYNYYDRETAKEMKLLGEVAIIPEGEKMPYVLNKDEYEILAK